jgi:putative membrane protein insertion efficiency factor
MSPVARILTGAVGLYRRYVSPLTPQRCRFEPTCSVYALQAISERGAVVGSALALRRIARCHQWSSGGIDRVPARPGG